MDDKWGVNVVRISFMKLDENVWEAQEFFWWNKILYLGIFQVWWPTLKTNINYALKININFNKKMK